MSMYWPIALAVFADVFYQVAAKSTPEGINPFASLTVTYMVGAAASAVIFFAMTKGGSLLQEWGQVNWATFLLGVAIVGLEAGSIYMYKVGWNVNTGYIVKSCFLAIALVAVGYLLYKEQITPTKVAGLAVCMTGLYLLNR
ncbi:MAG: EamA family transporter [Clostridiales bacterium]|nr:EamA family transporter [Clostridiales bacterium]